MGKSNKFSLTTKSHSSNRVNPYDKITLNALNVSCPYKQVVLPKLDKLGAQQFHIELYSFLIFIIALVTQYLNLYRSVWWISKNRNQQTINHHLIDLDASQFALIFIGQSFLISCLRFLTNTLTIPQTSQQQQAQSQHQNWNQSSLTNSQPPLTSILSTSLSSSTNSAASTASLSSSSTASSSSSSTSSSATTTTTSSSTLSTSSSTTNNLNGNSSSTTQHPPTCSLQNNANSSKHHQSPLNHHQAQPSPSSSCGSDSGQTIIVTATASWICNYFLFRCAYRIWNNFGLNGVSCISYPIVVSIIMNSTQIIQVVEGCRKTGKLNMSFLTISMTLFSSHIKFDDEKLCHSCYNQPDGIRDEVEKLRTIFNERLKFVLFKSVLLAYYSSFVPICFAQSFLCYDYTWTAQHVVITWFSSLIMLITSSYTPHFYDILHRSAYHFGKWQKLETRNTLLPCINWSENVIYPQGIVVKHYRGYFRSESVSNCAQPGVTSHLCYYIVFSNPRIGYATVLAMLGLLLTCQMYLLLISAEWYKLIAMTNMMLINVHSIFRLVKSLILITKIYKIKH